MKLFLFDLETTGTDIIKHGIHQISGKIIINGEVKETFDFKVCPKNALAWTAAGKTKKPVNVKVTAE